MTIDQFTPGDNQLGHLLMKTRAELAGGLPR